MTIDVCVLTADELEDHAEALAAILVATVHGGGAVGFVAPFERTDALAFWRGKVFPSVRAGERTLFVSLIDSEAAGTVQLLTSMPPNQPHRAEVAKMMVHPDTRNRGVAAALMKALEAEARRSNKTLITLDTRTGDAAERVYRRLSYQPAGVIPNYALNPTDRDFHATTYMYKLL